MAAELRRVDVFLDVDARSADGVNGTESIPGQRVHKSESADIPKRQ